MTRKFLLLDEKVGITFSDVEDASLFSEWLTSVQFRTVLGMCGVNTSVSQERHFIEKSGDSKLLFSIYDITKQKAVGFETLHNVDWINQTCEMGIFIGEPDAQKKGVGFSAARLLIGYAFDSLGMNNILIHIGSNNKAGLSLAQKLGFSFIGKRRNSFRVNREIIDDYMLDMTYQDYSSLEVQ